MTPAEVNGSGAIRAGAADLAARATTDREAIERLAHEFESLLITEMIRGMRRSMLDDPDEHAASGLGAGALTDAADAEIGSALGRAGGFGLAGELMRAFERQILRGAAPAADGEPADVPSDPAPSASAPPAASVPAGIAPPAPISSGFGMRVDPIDGTSRFHRGIDIAVAYGQDIRAAADGAVVFAGTQGGYGRTVVIDHGNGRQTRYAHLSEELVRAGDVVAAGQVLGKSGSSGRVTGAHLHFEVRVDGRAVDPRTLLDRAD